MASRGSISGISSAGTTQKVELQSSGSKTIKMNELKSQLSSDSSVQPSTSNADPNPAASAADFKEKKIGHRRVDETTGQVTYKKKATSDLMRAIQLGIGQSVGSLTSKPTRDVLMQDFSVVESVHFPENGSNLTPAHRVGEFRFKTYAPVAFRYFRELFGIRTDDFLVSLCSLPMTELSNPGASGSVFFITEDDEFIIKTVQHKEADFLQKLLPGYYMNLNQNPRTLLPKFYGLYCYQSGGKNIRIVVMNNLLPKAIRASEKYDLKGSTYKRKASKHELAKSSPTFKDLDFKDKNKDGIFLEADTFEALMKTMKRDCRVLESFKIMDYSLLLAVHNLDDKKRKLPDDGYDKTQIEEGLPAPSTSHGVQGAEAGIAVPGSINRGRSTKYRLQQFSTAMESIQADVDVVDPEDENIPHGGIPARNHKGEQLVLFMGIIDILQSYRLKKKLEHGFKSIVHDGDTISVVRPSFYSQRFLTFFEKEVFRKVPSPMRSPSKKKLYGRTRAEDNKDIGVGLVRSKPDVIAQVTESENSNPSTSSHLFPVRYSQNTINTSFTSSSTTNATGASYRAESNLSMVRESTSSTYDDHLPPAHADDPLPPYSEFHEFHPAQQHQFTGNFEPQKRSMQSAEADPQPLRLPLSVSSPIPASGAHRVDETVSAPSVTKKAGIDPSEATTSIAQDFEKGIRFSKKEENDESLAVANGQKLVNKGDDANDVPAADPAGVVLEIGDGSVALPSENEEF